MPNKHAFGIKVDIRPILLRVLIDKPCPRHGNPVVFITYLDGQDPDNKCLGCLVELLSDLADTAEESTMALRQQSG